VDEDCSGSDDCDCIDNDGDDYDGRSEFCPTGNDCDDTNDNIHPGREEIPYNYIDNNCNGEYDEGCTYSCTSDEDCSYGRTCSELGTCQCPHGKHDFYVGGDWIPVCDPVGFPIDTPCEGPWPYHEGSTVNYNERVPACDLFEVTGRLDLLAHAEKARDCCVNFINNNTISPGCHDFTKRAYDESGLDNALNYNRCIGLYVIYSNRGTKEDKYMQGYYQNEIDCGSDTHAGLGPKSCLGRAPGGMNYCCNIDDCDCWCRGICWPSCWGGFHPVNCYDEVHPNTNLLRCRWDNDQTPNGWVPDTDISANDCCFSDLPSHVSTEILSTRTCVDYSVVLTTLLRLSGYKSDEVYSTRSGCPGDIGHCFNLIKFPGDSRYTLVDTVGNCGNGYNPMKLPRCNGCYYWNYENCANDNGRVSCPERSDVWGAEWSGETRTCLNRADDLESCANTSACLDELNETQECLSSIGSCYNEWTDLYNCLCLLNLTQGDDHPLRTTACRNDWEALDNCFLTSATPSKFGSGISPSNVSVLRNPTLNSKSKTKGNVTVTRTVYNDVYIGEIVRVNITTENDNDYLVNVTVRDSIAGDSVWCFEYTTNSTGYDSTSNALCRIH
jgi:hypothetical protein